MAYADVMVNTAADDVAVCPSTFLTTTYQGEADADPTGSGNVQVIWVGELTLTPVAVILPDPDRASHTVGVVPITKLVPEIVTGTVVPATPLVGEILVTVGTGFITWNIAGNVAVCPSAFMMITSHRPSAEVDESKGTAIPAVICVDDCTVTDSDT